MSPNANGESSTTPRSSRIRAKVGQSIRFDSQTNNWPDSFVMRLLSFPELAKESIEPLLSKIPRPKNKPLTTTSDPLC